MRTGLAILASLAFASLTFTSLHGADAKPAKDAPKAGAADAKPAKDAAKAGAADAKPPKDAPKDAAKAGAPDAKPAKGAGFAGDLAELATTVGELSDEQKTKLQAVKATLAKDLEKFDKAAEPKIAATQARLDKATTAKDDKTAKDMKAYLDSIKAAREGVQAANDKKLFAVLTVPQRAKWNTPILKTEIDKEFSMAFLESKQEDKIAAFCASQARMITVPLDAEKAAKSLDSLKAQVYETILTPKQKAEYRKSKAAMTGDKK